MNKIIVYAGMLLLGLMTGSMAAFGTALVTGDRQWEADGGPTVFVPTGDVVAPLVFRDGRLAGYVTFTAQLEVPAGEGSAIRDRLPVLLNAINMRTFRTPLASGPDGMLPSVEGFRRVLLASAIETYGRAKIRTVVVTQAVPA